MFIVVWWRNLVKRNINKITTDNNGEVICLYVWADGILVKPLKIDGRAKYAPFYPHLIEKFLDLHPHIKPENCVIITNEKIVGEYTALKNVEQIIPTGINNDTQLSEDTITVTKNELLELFGQFIKNNLSVDISIQHFSGSAEVRISLELEGKEISSKTENVYFHDI